MCRQKNCGCNDPCKPKICVSYTPDPCEDKTLITSNTLHPTGYEDITIITPDVNQISAYKEHLEFVNSPQPLSNVVKHSVLRFSGKMLDYIANIFKGRNVGTGANVYKGSTIVGPDTFQDFKTLKSSSSVDVNNGTDEIIFSVNETWLEEQIPIIPPPIVPDYPVIDGISVGTGVSIYNGLTNKKIEMSSLKSDTLNIVKEINGDISINTSTDFSIKSFYVNIQYPGNDSTGSILKPFVKLTDALVAMIGTGTLASPQYYGAKIILQTDIVVEQIDLDTNPILENKLSVNSMTITSSNGKSNIYFRGTANYPIDTEFLITKVGFDGSLKLNLNVFINLNNIGLNVENNFGILKHRNYFNGTLYEVQNNSAITLENVDMKCNYTPQGSYTNALDSNGNPILFYGNTVKVQDSIPNNTPHVYVYGRNNVNEGSFIIKDISILGTSQIIFKVYDTILSFPGKVVCSRNVFYVNTDNIVTNGIYLPKNDLYLIELDNVSYCRIDNISEINQFPYNTVDNVQLGGDNAFIKLNNSNFITENYYNYGSHQLNYFLEMDELSNFSTNNSRFENIPILVEAFHPIGTFSTIKQIYFENSKINKVLSNNFKLIATDSIVNGYKYSSNISFSNNSNAIAGGLIAGNIYYNTTTNIATRVI